MLLMDVDGTFADGHIYMGTEGETMKVFDCKDGYGIGQMLPEMGIVPVIITGRNSQILANRAKELHIEELHQNVADKLPLLEEIVCKYGCSTAEIAYIGDDLACMEVCVLTACPKDAVKAIASLVDYVCQRDCGRGAVYDLIEYILKRD